MNKKSKLCGHWCRITGNNASTLYDSSINFAVCRADMTGAGGGKAGNMTGAPHGGRLLT